MNKILIASQLVHFRDNGLHFALSWSLSRASFSFQENHAHKSWASSDQLLASDLKKGGIFGTHIMGLFSVFLESNASFSQPKITFMYEDTIKTADCCGQNGSCSRSHKGNCYSYKKGDSPDGRMLVSLTSFLGCGWPNSSSVLFS